MFDTEDKSSFSFDGESEDPFDDDGSVLDTFLKRVENEGGIGTIQELAASTPVHIEEKPKQEISLDSVLDESRPHGKPPTLMGTPQGKKSSVPVLRKAALPVAKKTFLMPKAKVPVAGAPKEASVATLPPTSAVKPLASLPVRNAIPERDEKVADNSPLDFNFGEALGEEEEETPLSEAPPEALDEGGKGQPSTATAALVDDSSDLFSDQQEQGGDLFGASPKKEGEKPSSVESEEEGSFDLDGQSAFESVLVGQGIQPPRGLEEIRDGEKTEIDSFGSDTPVEQGDEFVFGDSGDGIEIPQSTTPKEAEKKVSGRKETDLDRLSRLKTGDMEDHYDLTP